MEKRSWIVVLLSSFLLTTLNSGYFIRAYIEKPPGTVFMGIVHWYEDYFYYLSQFTQGARGGWLVVNNYTSEITAPSLNYWLNLLMGKVGAMVGMAPVWSYNIWLVITVFFSLVMSYVVIRRFIPRAPAVIAYFYSALATCIMPVVNGHIVWKPIYNVTTPHFAFDRLGGIPRHAASTIIFYVLTLLMFTKPKGHTQQVLILLAQPILIGVLTITNPFMAAVWIGTLWIYSIWCQIRWKSAQISRRNLVIASISFIAAFVYIYNVMNTLPYLQSKLWDATQQEYPDILTFLASTGPISVLALVGIAGVILHPEPLLVFCVLLVLGPNLGYLSPIPPAIGMSKGRLLFPALYPFMAILAVKGTDMIAGFVSRKITSIHKRTVIYVIFVIFLFFSFPTLYWELDNKIYTGQNNNPYRFLNYVPADEYAGMVFLSQRLPYSDVVLASHSTYTDVLVPPLTNHTSYSGHALQTIRANDKNLVGALFYGRKYTSAEGKTWLKSSRIRYIIFTKEDGDRTQFEAYYPFLTVIYSNAFLSIYQAP